MMSRYIFFGLTLIISVSPAKADVVLPTPEQFQSLLTTCAGGAKIDVDGKLRGSLTDIYASNKGEIEAQKFVASVPTTFLDKVPDADKAKVYEVYVTCIQRILSGQKEFSQVEIPDVIELPDQLATFGKAVKLKAKKILAKDSIIRSFDPSARGSKGPDGTPGNNGSPGANGSGGQGGSGTNGGNGLSGSPGSSAGEIEIEADKFIGNLRIINSGMAGGNGGNGGNGGSGGPGGSGSNGQSSAFGCKAGPGMGGGGGNAGSGGDGGQGGDGGDGGTVAVKFAKVSPGSSVSIEDIGGQPGLPGQGGRQGPPGKGGPRGSSPGLCNSGGRGPGADGASGNPGRTSAPGRSGQDASIDLNIAGNSTLVTGKFSKMF
jgi:hypothetical protein